MALVSNADRCSETVRPSERSRNTIAPSYTPETRIADWHANGVGSMIGAGSGVLATPGSGQRDSGGCRPVTDARD